MNFKKGDTVKVTGLVVTKEIPVWASSRMIYTSERSLRYHTKQVPDHRSDLRDFLHYDLKEPITGVVVGWSTRISGIYYPGKSSWDEYDPGDIRDTQVHKVIMIEPLTTEQWIKPLACIEEDLEKIND